MPFAAPTEMLILCSHDRGGPSPARDRNHSECRGISTTKIQALEIESREHHTKQVL